MMLRVDNVFNQEQLKILYEAISADTVEQVVQEEYGRLMHHYVLVPDSILERLHEIVDPMSDIELTTQNGPMCVEYASTYGQPNLPPHFDGDPTDIIVDYQLESNTDWPLGVDLEAHSLDDNSALFFNPNDHIHWRPRKEFKDGEYVKMMFFRFFNPVEKSNNEHKRLSQNDPIFDEVKAYRDSL